MHAADEILSLHPTNTSSNHTVFRALLKLCGVPYNLLHQSSKHGPVLEHNGLLLLYYYIILADSVKCIYRP